MVQDSWLNRCCRATALGLPNATPSRAQSPTQNTLATAPAYDVASIKLDRTGSDQSRLLFPADGITATNVTLRMLIRAAYGVQDNQISGEPGWVKCEKYRSRDKNEQLCSR